ncbi:MAG: hypothetical protein E7515_03400 [Ruminococcaceae bacterium]|jgi:V/A-type H+-transporting ATPase subunit E|nr:hypothetical protein [Oscillospiraceae bacterium]
MANDNKLLSFIIEDGKNKAEKIVEDARAKCDEILENARLQAKENSDEIDSASSKQAQSLKNIASSNASLISRNTVLKARREEIDRTINEMENYILSLPDKEYFSLIYRLAKKAPAEKGEILLNKRDLSRIPSDFEKKMASAGINASVSKTPADINGGFILKDGSIEINCSVEALIEDNRSEIEDFINENIFKEEN